MTVMALKMPEGPEDNSSGPSWSNVIIRDYWEWASESICLKTGPKPFETTVKIPQAKVLCSLCPAAQDCLIWALIYDEHGIWGGTTRNERKEAYSKQDREILIEKAKLQGQYYSRETPGALIRQFLGRLEERQEG